MTDLTIFHNPRCSKSRQTLEIIKKNGTDVEVVEYLKTPPTVQQVQKILLSLNLKPQDIMRKKEAEYKQAGLDDLSLSEEKQVELMIANPKVIERPIVLKGDQAVIGRPPENVLELL